MIISNHFPYVIFPTSTSSFKFLSYYFKNLKRDYNNSRQSLRHPKLTQDAGLLFNGPSLRKIDVCSNLIFQNENNFLYKGSKTTYAKWCDKHKFKYANRVIPKNWLKEKGKDKYPHIVETNRKGVLK